MEDVRKNLRVPKPLWDRIAAFRFEHHIETMNEAMCRLCEKGLVDAYRGEISGSEATTRGAD